MNRVQLNNDRRDQYGLHLHRRVEGQQALVEMSETEVAVGHQETSGTGSPTGHLGQNFSPLVGPTDRRKLGCCSISDSPRYSIVLCPLRDGQLWWSSTAGYWCSERGHPAGGRSAGHSSLPLPHSPSFLSNSVHPPSGGKGVCCCLLQPKSI